MMPFHQTIGPDSHRELQFTPVRCARSFVQWTIAILVLLVNCAVVSAQTRSTDRISPEHVRDAVPEHRLPNGRPPCEDLLPDTTKALFVISDFDSLVEKASETDIGKIFEQEELQPLIDEVRRVIQEALTESETKLGITLDDLQGIRSGEFGIAALLPDPDGHAMAAIIDVEGNEAEAVALMIRVRERLVAEGATEQDPLEEADQPIKDLEMPWRRGDFDADHLYLALVDGFLLVSDHEDVVRSLVRSVLDVQPDTFRSLALTDTHIAIADRLVESFGPADADIRWFLEPFGLNQLIINAIPHGDRPQDTVAILGRRGFDAILAVGGDLSVNVDQFEVLHRTFVYAPPTVEDGEDGIRYEHAARALKFKNTDHLGLRPYPFVLPESATYVSLNWDMMVAFRSVGDLVDEIIGAPGAFDAMLEGMRDALDGPRVDIENELIANFEPRLTMVSDITEPIDVNSERMLLAIPVRDLEEVAEAVRDIMLLEPGVVPVDFEEYRIWWRDPEAVGDDGPDIGDPIFDPFGDDHGEEEPPPEESLAGWNCFTVANGFLLMANNLDLMKEVLTAEGDSLAETSDYLRVEQALIDIAGDEMAIVQFGRADRVLRSTFELIRQGKLPESQSIFAEVLNRQLGEGEPGVLRDQKIDPTVLPEDEDAFDRLIAPFIGPSGWTGRTEENGYFITGGILAKEEIEVEADEPDDDSDSSAANDSTEANRGSSFDSTDG